MKTFSLVLVLVILCAALFYSFSYKRKTPNGPPTVSIYSYKVNTLEGKELDLAQFKGKKLLIVNVASECGYTPQYKNLQALHEKYGNKLVILGFPANNFGQQEPGNAGQIKEFCTKNYGVTFQMMEKISVKGADAHPLYKWLGSKELNGSCDEQPKWNFCKYLIDEEGKVVKFFGSKVDPLDPQITSLL